jgi:hypothetical protein
MALRWRESRQCVALRAGAVRVQGIKNVTSSDNLAYILILVNKQGCDWYAPVW